MKIKVHRKLLIQIGFIVVLLFVLMIVAMLILIQRSTQSSFLEAQKDRLNEKLVNAEESFSIYSDHIPEVIDWSIDKWLKDPKNTVNNLNDEEMAEYFAFFAEPFPEGVENNSLSLYDYMPEKIQQYDYRMEYNARLISFEEAIEEEGYDGAFLLAYDKDKGEVIVLFETVKNGEGRKLGTRVGFPLEKHPAAKKALSNGGVSSEFEISDTFPSLRSNYVAYKLIKLGSRDFLLGVSYDWSMFKDETSDMLKLALSTGACALIIACAILLFFLNHKAIRPVEKITAAVSEYIETKQSDTVIKKMSEIKSRNELGYLSDRIADLAREIDHHTEEIVRLAEERQKATAELEFAAEIQANNLPTELPVSDEFELAASMNPAREVGGDFYDFFMIDDDHIALVIADVSGKGVPAAMFMMMSKNVIKNCAVSGLSPAEVLSRANQIICVNNESYMFVTVWLGIYEISTGHLIASNGGHEYPIVKQGSKGFELLKDTHCKMLGTIPEAVYTNYEMQLEKGDVIFLYTDGAPEATRSDSEMFGEDGVVNTLNNAPADSTPQQLQDAVKNSISEFVGDEPQFDDLTMLCFKRK